MYFFFLCILHMSSITCMSHFPVCIQWDDRNFESQFVSVKARSDKLAQVKGRVEAF